MVAGSCPFMGLYLDMEQGTVTPRYVTPEAVARIVGPGLRMGRYRPREQRQTDTLLRSKERQEKP